MPFYRARGTFSYEILPKMCLLLKVFSIIYIIDQLDICYKYVQIPTSHNVAYTYYNTDTSVCLHKLTPNWITSPRKQKPSKTPKNIIINHNLIFPKNRPGLHIERSWLDKKTSETIWIKSSQPTPAANISIPTRQWLSFLIETTFQLKIHSFYRQTMIRIRNKLLYIVQPLPPPFNSSETKGIKPLLVPASGNRDQPQTVYFANT